MKSLRCVRTVLMLFLFCASALTGKAQSVPVCEGEEFNLQNYLVQNFPACSVDSVQIISSDIPGVTAGEYQNPFEVPADGVVTVEIYEADGTLCTTETVTLDLVEANFVATAVQGSCLLVDFTPPTNTSSSCSYTYILDGDTVPGPLSQYQFSNGGLQTIRLNVQCGSCAASQQVQIDVDGPIADLDFSAGGLFFDPDFGSFVLCTEETTTVVALEDNSQQVDFATTIFNADIIFPDGSLVSGSTYPSPFEFTADQEGLYTIQYEVNDNGCIALESYELFVSNPNVSTQLEVPVTVEPFACEDETYEVNVCPNGCPTNPPGTVYEVILECTDFFFTTTSVPVTVPVPLNIASCGSSCTSGGGSIACSCDLVVRAIRPCANAVSNTICPFQIQPVPNANFNVLPFDFDNTYCAGTTLSFDPSWVAEDCNGANPALSICEIQNPEWIITPATGWTAAGGGLDEDNLSVQFTQPGEYDISFEWTNDCGFDEHTETVCILPNGDPPVSWFDVQVYCVGQTIDPTVNLPNVPCINPEIQWSGDDVFISDPTSPSPLVTFTETGSIDLELEVEGLCNDFSASTTYTVCDEPEITLSQDDVELCVGQEFCFDELISLQWNNCVGDVTWQFDSLPGSPIVNPSGTDLCFTWNDAEEFELYIEAVNDCGNAQDTITVTVVEAPSCPITPPGDFCIGDDVLIDPPAGAEPSSIEWFFSNDGGSTFNTLSGGMPDTPNDTTFYYVTALVNGCFCISDTVQANLIPEPVFDLITSNLSPCPGEPAWITSSPDVGDVTWDDGTGTSVSDTLFFDAPNGVNSYQATLEYGSPGVQCFVSESIDIDPVNNPLNVTCDFPALICEGDDVLDLPAVSPPGGTNSIVNSNGDVVLADVTEIAPAILPPDNYHFVYEIIESGCVFKDSCAFDIVSPQAPDLSPPLDTLCYDESVLFEDLNNLGGIWTSSCSDAIDGAGSFDPSGASCTPSSVVEIYYSGNCILNDTLEIFLIDIPQVSIVQSNPFPCPGEVVNYSLNPAQESVIWLDENLNELGTGPELNLQIDSPMEITAQIDVGVTTVSCLIETSVSVAPETNPIDIDCSAFPEVWCTGDDPLPPPTVSPSGGTGFITDEVGNVLFTDPLIIETESLGDGIFYYVYEITDWGDGGCTFRDSCQFTVSEPAFPVFEAVPDSICFNAIFDYNEVSGLNGTWSSSCLESIDPVSGLFQPSEAACQPGSDVELIYSGNCIENDTLSVHLIALPEVSIDLPENTLCANECMPFSQVITGDIDFYEWEIAWADQELNFQNQDPVFCPDEEGLNSDVTVQVELTAVTNTNPQCFVSETAEIQVIGIPGEAFPINGIQCMESAVQLPDCEECQSYDILFFNETEEFSCSFPGDACAPPDTGVYNYELIYDFESCQSDTVFGEIQIIDIPFLNILEAEYDTCSPVVNYTLEYGGFDISVNWATSGAIQQTNQTDINLYQTTINHSDEVEVDTAFTDVINVENSCGSVQASQIIFHAADPDFTLDPDSALYCQGQTVLLDIGFAQPMTVDSILIDYESEAGSGALVLNEIPVGNVPFNFDSDLDTLEISFQVTAYNSCATVTRPLTAFVLPTDVSADFDIPFSPPVCQGDSISIIFNSTGNVDVSSRIVETNNPSVEVVQVLGNWYLIPQAGFSDSEVVVNLTEYGFCGVDFDSETIELGPSLQPTILSEDVCRGEFVYLTPLLQEDAELTWELRPDSVLITDFPPPILYNQPGIYYPSVTAVADGFCDGTYVDTVEVFDPADPMLFCDADCDGGAGCKVTFGNGSVCISLRNPEEFNAFEWYVRREFFPEPGNEIEISVDDLVPCENNFVRLAAIDENGCEVNAMENIEFTDVLIYVPNAFTPNADGFNDSFKPVLSGDPVEYSLTIFDRWGSVVFESNDPEEPWAGNVEGKDYYSDTELYTYIIEFLPCQPEEEEKKEKRTGMITLIR